MFEYKITEEMIEEAERKVAAMGNLRNSITSGEGSVAGFLGEIVAAKHLDGVHYNTFDYDIVTHKTGKDVVTWDVKTKRCTSPPKSHYECSVAKLNTRQRCDNYIFVRVESMQHCDVNDTFIRAWVLGWMPKDEYLKKATYLKSGDIDPSNNFIVRSDCYNLRIDQLRQPESAFWNFS